MFDLESTNNALLRRVHEEIWNKAKPALAEESFAPLVGAERFADQFLLSFPDDEDSREDFRSRLRPPYPSFALPADIRSNKGW